MASKKKRRYNCPLGRMGEQISYLKIQDGGMGLRERNQITILSFYHLVKNFQETIQTRDSRYTAPVL
jgi:hypothetical protein